MKFSKKAEYGLRTMANLAKVYPQKKSLNDISQEERISLKFLEQVMSALKKSGLVISYKGTYGGYVLQKRPTKIRVGEIVELLEGKIAPMECVGKKCLFEHKCPTVNIWRELAKKINQTLYAIKLSDLVKK